MCVRVGGGSRGHRLGRVLRLGCVLHGGERRRFRNGVDRIYGRWGNVARKAKWREPMGVAVYGWIKANSGRWLAKVVEKLWSKAYDKISGERWYVRMGGFLNSQCNMHFLNGNILDDGRD